MNQQAALKALEAIKGKIRDLTPKISDAVGELKAAEAAAADGVSAPDFEARLAKVPTAAARVAALKTAMERLEQALVPAAEQVLQARVAEWRAESGRIREEAYVIHRQALKPLAALAKLMGVEEYPIGILFGQKSVSMADDKLDPRLYPTGTVTLVPRTMSMLERADKLRNDADALEQAEGNHKKAEITLLIGEEYGHLAVEHKDEPVTDPRWQAFDSFRRIS